MKITIIKKWLKWGPGAELVVSNKYGEELIKNGYAELTTPTPATINPADIDDDGEIDITEEE